MSTPDRRAFSFTSDLLSRRSLLARTAAMLAGLPTLTSAAAGAGRSPRFRLSFAPLARAEPYTGRVYVFFSRLAKEPRLAANWFAPEPMLARDVQNLRPGDVVELSLNDPDTLCFPRSLSAADLSGCRAQGVMRFSTWDREVGGGTGNGFSAATPTLSGLQDVSLVIQHVVPETPPPQSNWSRVLSVPSPTLSRFYGHDVAVQGMVTLPASYPTQSARRYPVIFNIPGFGGTLRMGYRDEPIPEQNPEGVEFLRVMLDPSCPLGHHVFADSANNGPWGTALVQEFLPALDAAYRTVAAPHGRLLTGHSSGGWSSLWLQITYPDIFGGVWSTAADPVDFRDFQRINIYRPGENMFVDPQGARRPLAHVGEKVLLWYDDFCRMEDVLGPGGQLHSFEAVFSPRGEDGRPRLLWNRDTGVIDPAVAETWRAYDIRQVLRDRWTALEPRLRGKLHLFMGDIDTFYLDGAMRLLQQELRDLGSDAIVEMHPGRDHSTLMTRELRARLRHEMAGQFLKGAAGRA